MIMRLLLLISCLFGFLTACTTQVQPASQGSEPHPSNSWHLQVRPNDTVQVHRGASLDVEIFISSLYGMDSPGEPNSYSLRVHSGTFLEPQPLPSGISADVPATFQWPEGAQGKLQVAQTAALGTYNIVFVGERTDGGWMNADGFSLVVTE